MYAAVKSLTTILSLQLLVDRLGRRKLLIASSIGTSLSLWYIGAFITAKHIDLTQPQAKSIAGWIAIICVYIYGVSPLPLTSTSYILRATSPKANFPLFNPQPTGILLPRLERRRLGLLRRDLPAPHQRTRSLHLHRRAMALAVRYRESDPVHAFGVEGRILLLFRRVVGSYGGGGLGLFAGD